MSREEERALMRAVEAARRMNELPASSADSDELEAAEDSRTGGTAADG